MNNSKNKELAVDQKSENLSTESSISLDTVVDTKVDEKNLKNKELTMNPMIENLSAESSASAYTNHDEINAHQSHHDSLLVSVYENKIDEC